MQVNICTFPWTVTGRDYHRVKIMGGTTKRARWSLFGYPCDISAELPAMLQKAIPGLARCPALHLTLITQIAHALGACCLRCCDLEASSSRRLQREPLWVVAAMLKACLLRSGAASISGLSTAAGPCGLVSR